MVYKIRIYGDPVLRKQAEPIERVDDEVRALADDMVETMRAERGVGLAAQQIGKTRAICIVSVPESYDVDEAGERLNPDVVMPMVLINPVITGRSDAVEKGEEGCLSFPEIVAPIPRAREIDLEYIDRDGTSRTQHLKGFVARAVQHEIDHLNGVLFIDRMSPVKRVALGGRLKRMRRETQRALGIA